MAFSRRSSASRAFAWTLALAFLLTASVAQAGACAPVTKTGANGQRFEWTPGKT